MQYMGITYTSNLTIDLFLEYLGRLGSKGGWALRGS